jgi:hypothetical protein
MNIWMDYYVRKEQQKDLVREATRLRAARRARMARLPARQPYAPLLVQLGRWLCRRGVQLQERYEQHSDRPSESPSPAQ